MLSSGYIAVEFELECGEGFIKVSTNEAWWSGSNLINTSSKASPTYKFCL